MRTLNVLEILGGVATIFVYLLLCVLLMAIAEPDYTDSGVGCVDDCLEIQDEAQTSTSKERN